MRILILFIVLKGSLFAKVYDCFTFYNELDLLNIRLHELNDYVDYFVIVESKDTFSGLDKPLFFKDNKHLYGKFLNKIIHIVVEKTPHFKEDAWQREYFQRNEIMRGLVHCEKEDVIIISDVDEIPKGRMINGIFVQLESKKRQIIACECTFYRWFLNRKSPIYWVGPAITRYKNLIKRSPQNVRDQRTKYLTIKNSAWHFSNMGGFKIYIDKMKAYSHFKESSDTLSYSNLDVYKHISKLELVEIDENFPKYLRDNYIEFEKKNFFDKGYYE
jgi:beta-1,4-mannosyl-glycoprotein beta-1,4-N-acetylglucosaminyltransferase